MRAMAISSDVPWTQQTGVITAEDEFACAAIDRRDKHFRFPLPHPERVFAIWMLPDGRASQEPGAGKVGNYVMLRTIKQESPEAWIWAERYTFTHEPYSPSWADAQAAFIATLGEDRLIEVRDRARAIGLEPGGKTKGRPDLAVIVTGSPIPWRFIEIKRRNDKLQPGQKPWLKLLAEVFGKQSAIEFYLRRPAR